jgi:ribosomal-protein-alanine N-acetyltransferase
MQELTIRQMNLKDIPDVMKVEKATFSSPWTTDIFTHELTDNRHAYYYVVEYVGQVIGYAGMWIVIDEAQITNIAILPDFRGKKIGEKLFSHMMLTAIRVGAVQLSLEVRMSNMVAQKMYQKFGLVPGGVRKNYYTDDQEDALVMWVKLR